MGATSSTAATGTRLPVGVNNLVGELGSDVQYERGMGSSRFLKAIKARHRHGPLVVKTFVKPEAFFSLRPLVRRIRVEREALADVPNTLTYQKVVETDTAGYLIRQWMSDSLYDRISTRPFLTTVEKKWITFQLLCAMREARKRGVPHGDLKTENVLVTSSLSVYVTDFASSFKQVYLPLNDPSDFNFYFGTSGRRTCYVAPERFYAEGSDIAKQKAKARSEAAAAAAKQGSSNTPGQQSADAITELFKRDGKVSEAMDVFSLGCVIGELWRDGAPMFTLMQLFKYREGQFDIQPALQEIPDRHIREIISNMVSLDPKKRNTFSQHLEHARDVCFPNIFYTFLHRYLTTLQRTSARTAAMAAAEAGSQAAQAANANSVADRGQTSGTAARSATANANTVASSSASEMNVGGDSSEIAYLLRAEADERIERMYEEWSVLTSVLDGTFEEYEGGDVRHTTLPSQGVLSPAEEYEPLEDATEVQKGEARIQGVLPVRVCIPGVRSTALSVPDRSVTEDGSALLILSPLLANLRNAVRPSTKLHCLDLLLHLSCRWLSDEAKLDRVLPYIIFLSEDESIMVRVAVVRSIVQLLSLVRMIMPSNASTFIEYVMPNLRPFARDSSSLVRATYASCLVELTRVGTRFQQMASAMRAEGIFAADVDGRHGATGESADEFLDGSETRVEAEVKFDRQMDVLRAFFQEQALLLLTDASPVVKRNLLSNIGPLCTFFGSAITNDVILSHVITYLNDRSWMLRKAFFDAIVDVACVAGARSVENYILTLLLQALSDPEEFVVLHVLQGLRRLLDPLPSTGKILLSRAKILDVIGATVGFLCHPNHWLRTAAAFVISRGASHIGTTDTWAIVYPSLRPLLRSDVEAIESENLLFAVKEPISREVLQKAVQWAFRAKNSKFWKAPTADAKSKAGLANGLGRQGISLMIGQSGKSLVRTPIPRNEEDDAHIDSLRSSGLTEDDEVKLVALREYITKLAKVSSLMGPSVKSSSSAPLVNQEDANMLPPLQIKSGLAVQPLENVTPLTIFFTSATAKASESSGARVGAGAETASIPASMRSHAASSTFSGRMARRRLAGTRIVSDTSIISPLEELRRRMNEAQNDGNGGAALALPPTPTIVQDFAGEHGAQRPSSPTSVLSGAGSIPPQGKLGSSKAQAAIAANPTTAMGTMAEGSARSKTKERITNLATQSEQTTPTGTMTPNPINEAGGAQRDLDYAGTNEPAFASTYDGNDPYIRAHLEAIYLSTFQERQPGWGPTIPTIMSARRKGGVGVRSATAGARSAAGVGYAANSVASNRRPEGNLIAYFTEHTAPITSIVVSPDHAFFLTGSEDGTIKIWDTARLEKNVTSRSRGTYNAQRGKIVSLIMLEASHCAASAATDGSVHVLRVEMFTSTASTGSSALPKYGKIRLVSNFQLSDPDEHVVCMRQGAKKSGITTREAALHASGIAVVGSTSSPASSSSSLSTESTGSTLILATSKSNIVILDLRTMQVLANYNNPAHLGAIAAMCIDPKNIWLLVATIGGGMCLWDLRFHLLVKTWRLATLEKPYSMRNGAQVKGDDEETAANDSMGSTSESEQPIVRVNSIVLHPSKGKGRWVMIAFERLNLNFQGEGGARSVTRETLIETWDVEQTVSVETYSAFRHDTSASPARHVEEDDVQIDEVEEDFETSSSLLNCDDRFAGLESAADAIERLVRLHEAAQQRTYDKSQGRSQLDSHAKDGERATNEAAAAAANGPRRIHGREVLPSPAPTAFVRSLLVSTEGYTSSALPNAAQVSGGWLDAGKLVKADDTSGGGVDDQGMGGSGGGVAGYMITAGTDRKIRFWDLGRVEKSTAFGATTDERNEFRVQSPNARSGSTDTKTGVAKRASLQQQQGQQKKGDAEDAGHIAQGRDKSDAAERTMSYTTSGKGGRSAAEHDQASSSHAVCYEHHAYPTNATMRAAASALRSPLLTHHSSASTTNLLMKAHKDAITALAIVELPFRCIVAGDYAGNVRVWE